jgi:putative PIN family toxin of toxin-antitoxin system
MSQRIVVDTNVLASGLRSSRGASHRLMQLIGASDFEIALSVPLVLEYEDALKRGDAAPGVSNEDIEALIDYLCSVAHLQDIHFLWRPVLRDPKDDHVLELAVEAGCSLIVTHNIRDFAESEAFGVTAIRPGEFLRRIGAAS